MASCLIAAAVATVIAVLGWIFMYSAGMTGFLMAILLLLLLIYGGVLAIAVLILAVFKHPVARQATPLLLALFVFGSLTAFGMEVVVPQVYEWRIGITQADAVAAIEGHRSREGQYPTSTEAKRLLPRDVTYSGASSGGYELSIGDRFAFLGGGWTYESSTQAWSHWVD